MILKRLPATAAGLVAAALLCVSLWSWAGRAVDMPDGPRGLEGKIHCLSYTPYRGDDSPFDPDYIADPQRIDQDFAQLSAITDCVRIYSTGNGLDASLPLARKYGMKILMGIWIGRSLEANEEEIASAERLAKQYPDAIKALIVGNEVLLRGEQQPADLAAYVRRVKADTGLPVTYADVTDFWLKAPQELVDAVDFVTIHILPYWENNPVSAEAGVAYLKSVEEDAARILHGKRIFIGETGFPSAGRQRDEAAPSLVAQARYLREFMAYASAIDLDYNLIEAFDQPWKRALEGTAGGAWGVFTTDRHAKFNWQGPVSNYPDWPYRAALCTGIALLLLLWMAARGTLDNLKIGAAAGVIAGACATSLLLQIEHSWVAMRSPFEATIEALLFAQTLMLLACLLPELTRAREAATPQAFAQVLASLFKPSFTREHLLGFIQLLSICTALAVSLALVFDQRYRDFPVAAYAPAALGFVLLYLTSGQKAPTTDRREEALLATALIACALTIAISEGPQNIHALAWCGLNLAFALPFIREWRKAVRSLIMLR